jgi:hypothetical protein
VFLLNAAKGIWNMINRFVGHVFGLIIFTAIPSHILVAAAEQSPTILQCMLNATASRGYGFDEKQWLGVLTGSGSANPPFEVSVTGKSGRKSNVIIERFFSGLDTKTPKVRDIRKGQKDLEVSAEVISRVGDSLVLLWHSPKAIGVWVWIALIDRERRTAVVASVYGGMTYNGGELETMDCR